MSCFNRRRPTARELDKFQTSAKPTGQSSLKQISYMTTYAITEIQLGPKNEIMVVILRELYSMPKDSHELVGLHDGTEVDALYVVDRIKAGDKVFAARKQGNWAHFSVDVDHPVIIKVLHGGEEQLSTDPEEVLRGLPRA